VLAEDAEIVPVRAAVDGTVYRGPDAGAQYCAAVEESWENLRWEIERSTKAATGCSPWDTYEGGDAGAGSRSTPGRAGWPGFAEGR
jgi:hypothetical protein